jgi:general stress protein YciG
MSESNPVIEFLREAGRKGGKSRSDAKRRAGAENLAKARKCISRESVIANAAKARAGRKAKVAQ